MNTGVAVPAIRKKIITWSSRCRRCRDASDQVPQWYSALIPNSAPTLTAYTPKLRTRAVPGVWASSTVLTTSDAPNQSRCSQPRITGLV